MLRIHLVSCVGGFLNVVFSLSGILILNVSGGDKFPWCTNFITVAHCDSPSSSPSNFTNEVVEPRVGEEVPHLLPAVAHPLVPFPEHPLIEDDVRLHQLSQRLLVNNAFSTQFISQQEVLNHIVYSQATIENTVEAALVQDGFHSENLFYKINEIRSVMFYPQGKVLSHETYLSYVRDIDANGTRASLPYRRVLNAIRRYDLFILKRGRNKKERLF